MRRFCIRLLCLLKKKKIKQTSHWGISANKGFHLIANRFVIWTKEISDEIFRNHYRAECLKANFSIMCFAVIRFVYFPTERLYDEFNFLSVAQGYEKLFEEWCILKQSGRVLPVRRNWKTLQCCHDNCIFMLWCYSLTACYANVFQDLRCLVTKKLRFIL